MNTYTVTDNSDQDLSEQTIQAATLKDAAIAYMRTYDAYGREDGDRITITAKNAETGNWRNFEFAVKGRVNRGKWTLVED